MAPPPVTAQETVEALLKKSQRRHAVPFRVTFVQRGDRKRPDPGVLANLVHNHDARALDLYMLLMAAATHEPYDVVLPAPTWARMLGLQGTTGEAAISRIWARLDALGLVERSRKGRRASIRLLAEDGSCRAYDRPSGYGDYYFQVPLDYWARGWHLTLDLASKAMLLVALSLEDGFNLPSERVPQWYGISADTAERGLASLRGHKLLVRRKGEPKRS